MTLELARKRRDQSDLIHELVDAVAALLEAGAHTEPDATVCPRCVAENAARAVLEKAKEHDCIPWDDAKEVAQQ